MRAGRCIGVLTLGLGAMVTLLLWLTAVAHADPAAADILYAALDCTGLPNCYPSIQAAVNAAHDGDTIRVIQGTYLEAVTIAKSVTLEGGWSKDTLRRDWTVYTTTIDARQTGSVIRTDGPISPTIDGFVLTGGDASSYLGWGGGILIQGNWGGAGLAIIRHNVITDNVACRLTACQGYGGGIMVYSSQSIIEYNTVISNAARTGGNGSGTGGGIAIWGYPSESTVAHNDILSNTAVFSPAGAYANGKGGGFWSEHDVTLVDNDLRGNVAARVGEGLGGGVYAGGKLYDNRILNNTATMNGTGLGGGVYAYYVTDFEDNQVQDNVASASGDGSGGAIYAIYLRRARHNQIEGNRATRGGGVYLSAYLGSQEFTDNQVVRNRATGNSLATWDGGGGIASQADWVQISRNDLLSNTAAYLGGGLLVTGGKRYVAEDNLLQGNEADFGGGTFVYSATGTIAHNQIVHNTANNAGGGIYLYTNAAPTVDSNVLLSNTASSGGGGVCILGNALPVTLTNQIIAHSGAGASGGAGVLVNGSQSVYLFNNTLVDNSRSSNREGVRLTNGSRVTMTNNILVGHSVGVYVAAGSVAVLTRNDYWDNTTAVSGQPAGLTDMALDPQFASRAGSDYHLSLTSLVVDQGDNGVGVLYDFEGDPRPRGARIDVGADEAYRAESYVSQATGSDLTGTGSPAQPFATVTRALTETRAGGMVYVGRGTYTERITITRSINLFGGYRETDWTRNVDAFNTTLDGQRAGTVVAIRGARVRAAIEGFTITGGEASVYGSGGGLIAFDGAAASIRHNTIAGNHARNGGGGLLLWGSESLESVVEANRIYNNVADGVFALSDALSGSIGPQQGPEPGGGLLVVGPARVVNNWVYGNSASAGGDGMALKPGEGGPVYAYHNTVADNAAIGIHLGWGDVYLYNNLIVGQQTGIHATETAQPVWDYNGFYDTPNPYSPGLIGGAHDVMGNPLFANRPAHDYHIALASPMAGAGIDVGVMADLDGEARPAPAGTRPDIGADEVRQQRTYLPLALK